VAALTCEARRRGVVATIDRWRWVLLTLAAIPVHYALRVVLARPGPINVPGQVDPVGAYPSGTALASVSAGAYALSSWDDCDHSGVPAW
jgi:hypothetical protein